MARRNNQHLHNCRFYPPNIGTFRENVEICLLDLTKNAIQISLREKFLLVALRYEFQSKEDKYETR
jgi:hypothetical protein